MEWLIGIASGIISGLICGGVFYFLAGRDLKRESKELARISGVVLRGLRDHGAEVVYKDGVPVGLNFHLQAGAGSFSVSGGGTGLIHRDNEGDIISEG